MLDSDQLAGMRTTVDASLNTTCVRRRFAVGADDAFGIATQGAATNTTYACRFVPAPGSELTTDRDIQIHEASVLLPYDADVVGGDLLIVDGATFEVIGPAVGQSWETHLRVLVRRTEAT